MSSEPLVAIVASVFAAAFLKGITGLGFSTICLGLLASFVDIKFAIPLVLVPSLSSNVLVMLEARGFRRALVRFWPLYLAAVPGLAVGLVWLGASDGSAARQVLGTVLFLYGVWGLANSEWRLPGRGERLLKVPVGALTGMINGFTGSQVMPVLPYLLSLDLNKNELVQSINISFTLSSLLMLAGLFQLGMLNGTLMLQSVLGVVPVAVGIWLGSRVRRRLSETIFKKMVLLLLIGLGVNLVV